MITLECNYQKKLGLPGYSSHQFAITLRTEIADLNQVQAESARLYKLLQEGVDTSIKETGYLPTNGAGNGQRGGQSGNGNGQNPNQPTENGAWNCSGKQKDLILKIVEKHKLEKAKVEGLAQDRFGKTVKALNKLEASGLIEELLEMTGQSKGRSRFQGRYQRAGGAHRSHRTSSGVPLPSCPRASSTNRISMPLGPSLIESSMPYAQGNESHPLRQSSHARDQGFP
jgi:hypothetical protein